MVRRAMAAGIRDRWGGVVPVSVRDWHWHAVCPRCGWHGPALDGDVGSLRAVRCGGCGGPVSADWGMVRMRWRSAAVWWRPWSWGRGVWEGEEGLAAI